MKKKTDKTVNAAEFYEFQSRLFELRGGMSVNAAAAKIRISRSALEKYENGERKPDIGILLKICKAYNVTADYLLGLSDVKAPTMETKAMSDYSGLSEDAINKLHDLNETSKDIQDDSLKNCPYPYDSPEYAKEYKKSINATLNSLKIQNELNIINWLITFDSLIESIYEYLYFAPVSVRDRSKEHNKRTQYVKPAEKEMTFYDNFGIPFDVNIEECALQVIKEKLNALLDEKRKEIQEALKQRISNNQSE